MTASVPTSERTRPTWPVALLAGLFGLFYAYAVWTAVDFLISQASGVPGLNGAGWALLLFAVAFPIIVFVAAVLLARRRPLWQLAVVLLVGLGLVAVFWINVLAFAFTSGETLIGV